MATATLSVRELGVDLEISLEEAAALYALLTMMPSNIPLGEETFSLWVELSALKDRHPADWPKAHDDLTLTHNVALVPLE